MREDAEMDFEEAGLLDGLEGEERAARERLLKRLVDEGVELDELKAAVAEQRLALVPVERTLGGGITAREIEERTGVPAELTCRMRKLIGLPEPGADDPVFGEDDVKAAESIKLFLDNGFDESSIAEMTQVLGESMARVAATTTASFVSTFLKPGGNEEQVADRFATLSEQLTPAFNPVLAASFRAHLRESVSRGILGQAELQSGEVQNVQELAVCFADLVGFTRLGAEIEVGELGTVAGQLGSLATECSVAPVRLVKTIGDAAMFVSTEVPALVETALSLIEAFKEAELPALRAGIASGSAAIRAGDYYGNSVNLASRVTGSARPGSVLCTEEIRDAAREQFDWSFAGKHKLKGLGNKPLYRARQRGAAEEQEKPKKQKASRRRK